MDTLVIDIETQNFFTDPEVGWDNFAALKISVVGVYSYAKDAYFCFEEHELPQLMDMLRETSLIVGFSSNRYDIPVLNLYAQRLTGGALNLWHKDRVDLLEVVESATSGRVSLNRLAKSNLGIQKNGHGSEAIVLYRDGRIEELKAYCLKDVEITKGLYDLYVKQGYLLVPNVKTGELEKALPKVPAQTAPLF